MATFIASGLLPGVYPLITQLKPKIGGANNLGVGVDVNGNEFVIKQGNLVCIAEFVGAAVCQSMNMPHCEPTIVCMHDMSGQLRHLFGSRIEDGLLHFDQNNIAEWRAVVTELCNAAMFTVTLAVDLCLGNDDRHQSNWLVRAKDPAQSKPCHQLIALDFSNAWPTIQPPHHPLRHPSGNTLNLAKHWDSIGVTFDEKVFRSACAKISLLDSAWLKLILVPMVNIWLTESELDAFCQWWQQNWNNQVLTVISSLEPDGDWQ